MVHGACLLDSTHWVDHVKGHQMSYWVLGGERGTARGLCVQSRKHSLYELRGDGLMGRVSIAKTTFLSLPCMPCSLAAWPPGRLHPFLLSRVPPAHTALYPASLPPLPLAGLARYSRSRPHSHPTLCTPPHSHHLYFSSLILNPPTILYSSPTLLFTTSRPRQRFGTLPTTPKAPLGTTLFCSPAVSLSPFSSCCARWSAHNTACIHNIHLSSTLPARPLLSAIA